MLLASKLLPGSYTVVAFGTRQYHGTKLVIALKKKDEFVYEAIGDLNKYIHEVIMSDTGNYDDDFRIGGHKAEGYFTFTQHPTNGKSARATTSVSNMQLVPP